MIDEEWLKSLDFSSINGLRIKGFLGIGNEKVVLHGVTPEGEDVAVTTYKYHLGYHIKEIPPHLTTAPQYDVDRLNRKLRSLVGCGYVDSISSMYDRLYSAVMGWLHSLLMESKREGEDQAPMEMIMAMAGSLCVPACPEALPMILASPGMGRRLQEIALLPPAGDDIQLMMPRLNGPFPITGYRDHLVKWATSTLASLEKAKADAPFEPVTLDDNPLYTWGAAVTDGFFTDAELVAVADYLKREYGSLVQHPRMQVWFDQIDAIAHLSVRFLENTRVDRLVQLCASVGLLLVSTIDTGTSSPVRSSAERRPETRTRFRGWRLARRSVRCALDAICAPSLGLRDDEGRDRDCFGWSTARSVERSRLPLRLPGDGVLKLLAVVYEEVVVMAATHRPQQSFGDGGCDLLPHCEGHHLVSLPMNDQRRDVHPGRLRQCVEPIRQSKPVGRNGATPAAIAEMDVYGLTRISVAARPRAAISAATPVPSEIPMSATRCGPIP